MQNHTLNVMQIIGDLDIGGAQEVVRTLAEYLASDDCRPIVCTFGAGDGRGGQVTSRNGVQHRKTGR
jgi:hypothetical protein